MTCVELDGLDFGRIVRAAVRDERSACSEIKKIFINNKLQLKHGSSLWDLCRIRKNIKRVIERSSSGPKALTKLLFKHMTKTDELI